VYRATLFSLASSGRKNYSRAVEQSAVLPSITLNANNLPESAIHTAELNQPATVPATAQRSPVKAHTDPSSQRLQNPTGPASAHHRKKRGLLSFAICVGIPALLASVYYGLISSNQYVAEFRFAVKDVAQRTPSANSPLVSILGGLAGTNNSDNYLVVDYLTSRQAVEELEKRIRLTTLYSSPNIDWLSRYSPGLPIERFLPYWQTVVTARYDQVTGIAVAQIKAFTPQDALLIAESLVLLSEELVNGIANRAQNDIVRNAQREVQQAEQRLVEIRTRLTEYRNRTGVIDPTTSVAASNAALVQTLRATLAQLETQQSALRQQLDANSPTLTVLANQIKSTRDQLQKIESSVTQDRDGVSLSRIVAEYEKLDLERQFAQNMLTGAMQALDQARASASSQHLYITPYVRPHLPQSATHPRRFLSVISVIGVAFLVWISVLLFARSIRERFS
jgi:capsular polysaccharide transport system permease protein